MNVRAVARSLLMRLPQVRRRYDYLALINAQRADLEVRVSRMQAAQTAFTAEIERLSTFEGKASALQADVERIYADALKSNVDANAAIQSLDGANQAQAAQIAQLDAVNRALARDLDDLRYERDARSQTIGDLEHEIHRIEIERAQASSAQQASIADLDARLAALTAAYAARGAELAALQQDYSDLEVRLTTLMRSERAAKNEAISREIALEAAEARSLELERRMHNINSAVESAHLQRAEMEDRLAETARLAATARLDARLARIELETTQSAWTALDQRSSTLAANFEAQLEQLTQAERQKARADFASEIQAAQEAAANARAALDLSEARIQAEQARSAAADADAATARAFSAQLTGRLSALDYDLRSLTRTLQSERFAGGAGSGAYLDLLEDALTGRIQEDPAMSPWSGGAFDSDVRFIGRDWPAHAFTMIGNVRLRNLRTLVEQVLQEGVEGDLIEAGVWRGGACIYMRAILLAYGDLKRRVWLADSFEGLPPPDVAQYPADSGDEHWRVKELSVSIEDVKRNFRRFGLLNEQVQFLQGWFNETLPKAPIEKLAVLRLDGDMYGSTMETLQALYPRVSTGGFVIVDDYILKPCAEAVDDYRRNMKIDDALVEVDGAAVYWQKS